jgi:hypothetical protein
MRQLPYPRFNAMEAADNLHGAMNARGRPTAHQHRIRENAL